MVYVKKYMRKKSKLKRILQFG